MIRFLLTTPALCFLFWTTFAFATSLSDERASIFLSGDVAPGEAFGTIEGPVLLSLGVLMLVVAFVFLYLAGSVHSANADEIGHLETMPPPGENNDSF